MTTKELINQYVTAHADNRWMDASELEALLTEFAEKLKEPASELTWQDIQRILDAADQLAIDYGSEKLNEIGYEDYCKEVLARYMETIKE